MKIAVLKPIAKHKTAQILELTKEEITLKDILKYRILDMNLALELLSDKEILGPGEAKNQIMKISRLSEFTVRLKGKRKKITGIVATDSMEDAIEILDRFYVKGEDTLDSFIEHSKNKREGITRAFLNDGEYLKGLVMKSPGDFLGERNNGRIKFLKYRKLVIASCVYGFEKVVGFIRECYLNIKKHRIKRTEFLVFSPEWLKPENELLNRLHRNRKGINPIPRVLYYDGKKYKLFNSLPSEVSERFERNGKMHYINSDFLGYNFLKFIAFVPFKNNNGKKKTSPKRFKNPFNVPALFAFDSRVPLNIPARKIKIIDDEKVIKLFFKVRNANKVPADFPVVYFHSSVGDSTKYLLIAGFKK